jgi:hypothetical protein
MRAKTEFFAGREWIAVRHFFLLTSIRDRSPARAPIGSFAPAPKPLATSVKGKVPLRTLLVNKDPGVMGRIPLACDDGGCILWWKGKMEHHGNQD